jgi:hypothetical protein
MTTQSVTLYLPDSIYQRVQQIAQALQRPVEELLMDAVATGLPLLDDLPPDLVDDMAALPLLNDAGLWRVARSSLSDASQERLDALLDKKSQDELTDNDQQDLDQLLSEYERVVLIRAQAALLLKQRKYDISDPSVLNTATELP